MSKPVLVSYCMPTLLLLIIFRMFVYYDKKLHFIHVFQIVKTSAIPVVMQELLTCFADMHYGKITFGVAKDDF